MNCKECQYFIKGESTYPSKGLCKKFQDSEYNTNLPVELNSDTNASVYVDGNFGCTMFEAKEEIEISKDNIINKTRKLLNDIIVWEQSNFMEQDLLDEIRNVQNEISKLIELPSTRWEDNYFKDAIKHFYKIKQLSRTPIK